MASHHHLRQHPDSYPSQYHSGQATYVISQSLIWQGAYHIAPASASGGLVESYSVIPNGPQHSIGGGGSHPSYPHGSQQGVLAIAQTQSPALVYAAPDQSHQVGTPIYIGSSFVSSGLHYYDLRTYYVNTLTDPPASLPNMQRALVRPMYGHALIHHPHSQQVAATGVGPTIRTSSFKGGRIDGDDDDAHLRKEGVDMQNRRKRSRKNKSV